MARESLGTPGLWHQSLRVIKSTIQSLSFQLVFEWFQQLHTNLCFDKMKVSHSMCGPHKVSNRGKTKKSWEQARWKQESCGTGLPDL